MIKTLKNTESISIDHPLRVALGERGSYPLADEQMALLVMEGQWASGVVPGLQDAACIPVVGGAVVASGRLDSPWAFVVGMDGTAAEDGTGVASGTVALGVASRMEAGS